MSEIEMAWLEMKIKYIKTDFGWNEIWEWLGNVQGFLTACVQVSGWFFYFFAKEGCSLRKWVTFFLEKISLIFL